MAINKQTAKPAAAPQKKFSDGEFSRMMNQFTEMIAETAKEFPKMTEDERLEIINEFYDYTNKCRGERSKRLFQSIGDWLSRLHSAEVSNAQS